MVTARENEPAVEILKRMVPDLILLDVVMPGLGGLFLCRKFKSFQGLADVPVIFVTPSNDPDEISPCFDAGASDYVAKPVNQIELLARVRTHLELREALLELERLKETPLDVNPLTQLPGRNPVTWTIQDALDKKLEATVIACDLDDFRAYNQRYGYAQGDRVLKFVAGVLEESVQAACRSEGFIGHLGGDDFLLIVASDLAEVLGHELSRRFDEGIPALYQRTTSRKGNHYR